LNEDWNRKLWRLHILSAAIGATSTITAADFEFACKAGTAAIQVVMGMSASGAIDYGLAVGADTSQGAPGDALEYGAAAGGAAFIIGSDPTEFIVEIEDTCSFTTDTPDFWRREGADYPSHGGRFTGEPAYFKHVTEATQTLLDKIDAKPSDFDYAIFHQPNGKFPVRVAKKLDDLRDCAPKVEAFLTRRKYLDYGLYAKHKGKIIL